MRFKLKKQDQKFYAYNVWTYLDLLGSSTIETLFNVNEHSHYKYFFST